jgi:hypothetical protein
MHKHRKILGGEPLGEVIDHLLGCFGAQQFYSAQDCCEISYFERLAQQSHIGLDHNNRSGVQAFQMIAVAEP